MYKLRNLLFPYNRAHPELAKITYHLVFTTGASGSRHVAEDLQNYRAPLVSRAYDLPDSSDELPTCLCPGAVTNSTLFNTSDVTCLTYGWTSIGIYTFIHPALLNQFQVQLPFAIMRRITFQDNPFLWNGLDKQLPRITIHLSVSTDNLTCFPGDSEVDRALKMLTSFVSTKFHCMSTACIST